MVLIFGPGEPYQLPNHYRVELEVPPVDAALWFAARYPQYFTSGEHGLQTWLDGLDPRDRVFVLAMAQTLTWAWVEHELASFEARELNGVARESTIAVRHKTLNQLELDFDRHREQDGIELNAFFGDRHFEAGVFARLGRGASNCEGQNHLLAVLLGAALEPEIEWIPAVTVLMAGVPRHELVRLSGVQLAQPVFVDAWSNLPAFTVDPSRAGNAPLLAELGDPPPPVVPGLITREPFLDSEYASSDLTWIELIPERDAPTKRVSLKVRAPALDAAALARIEDPWRIYLYARILHIYDDPRAAGIYRFVLEHHCDSQWTFVCVASAKLLQRV